MSTNNSFDRLTDSLPTDERLEILKRISSASIGETTSAEEDGADGSEQGSVEIRYKQESFFVKLWLKIKALFTNIPVEDLYKDHLLKKKGVAIEKEFSDIYDNNKRLLLNGFYVKLHELKHVADFFKPYIVLYDENPGKFYVYLGASILTDFTIKAEEAIDPAGFPPDKQPSPEIKTSLARRLDDLIQQISQSDRGDLYAAVQSLDWLRMFVKLPFDHLLTRFMALNDVYSCRIDSAQSELASFCRVLCRNPGFSASLLEALFSYFAESAGTAAKPETEKDETLLRMKTASELLTLIKLFRTSVPIHTLAALSYRNVFWEPPALEGSQDWFVKFKSSWKKKFELAWAVWIKERKRSDVRRRVMHLLSVADFPPLPNRPWEEVWVGVSFVNELVSGFIYSYYERLYPVHSKCFKILMSEGEFAMRENRVDFTDAYNELNHQGANILRLNERLAPNGELGQIFTRIIRDQNRTVQGKAQIDSLMMSIVTEVESIETNFLQACRLLPQILSGILSEQHNNRYGTLINLSYIQGKNNMQFRGQLRSVHSALLQVAELLTELDSIESKT